MSAKHLIVGLDGADLDVIGGLGPRRLPALHALMDRGAYARMESVQPPATLPNWTTFLTGVDPARHGVFDFTTREGYQVRFTAGTVRQAPTMISRLDRLGLRCACVGFPATWPPERLEHGVFMSGWDAPVASQADRSFVWPPSMYDDIVERFGTPRFDDVDEFDAESPGWHERLPAALQKRIEAKTELALWLLESRDWDVFAFYFGESDTVSHHLWAHHDPYSPRHPEGASTDGLAQVYVALDRALATLVAHAGDEVEITVVSDHGSGGSGTAVLYLNRALEEAGLLRFRPGRGRLVGLAKKLALTALPPLLRERVFRFGGALLPSLLESQARFGAIDMAATTAFSDELNYFPGVWLNIAGRDPDGTIAPDKVAQARRAVEAALKALRNPWTGEPVVAEVWPREALFEGPFIERAPDLLLRLHLDDGYSYNLMPSGSAPPGTGPWRRLAPKEHLGRKGRSLPGSHRERGIFIAAGPSILQAGEVDVRIADATATLLARAGIAVPPEFSGRVLWEILAQVGEAAPLPDAPVERGQGDSSAVERRLRALGYIDGA